MKISKIVKRIPVLLKASHTGDGYSFWKKTIFSPGVMRMTKYFKPIWDFSDLKCVAILTYKKRTKKKISKMKIELDSLPVCICVCSINIAFDFVIRSNGFLPFAKLIFTVKKRKKKKRNELQWTKENLIEIKEYAGENVLTADRQTVSAGTGNHNKNHKSENRRILFCTQFDIFNPFSRDTDSIG